MPQVISLREVILINTVRLKKISLMIKISETKSIHPSSLGPIDSKWEKQYKVEDSGWRRFSHYEWIISFTVGEEPEHFRFSGPQAHDIYKQITGEQAPPMPGDLPPDLPPIEVKS